MSSFTDGQQEVEKDGSTNPRDLPSASSKSARKGAKRVARPLSDGFRPDNFTSSPQGKSITQRWTLNSKLAAEPAGSVPFKEDECRVSPNQPSKKFKRQRIVEDEEDTGDEHELPQVPLRRAIAARNGEENTYSDNSIIAHKSSELGSDIVASTSSEDQTKSFVDGNTHTPTFAGKHRFKFSSSPLALASSAGRETSSHVRPLFLPPNRTLKSPHENSSAHADPSYSHSMTPQLKSFLFKSAENFQHSPATLTENKTATELQNQNPKLAMTISILPEAFSPHRRKDRFQPDGWASQVRSWIIESSAGGLSDVQAGQMHKLSGETVKVICLSLLVAGDGNCAGFSLMQCELVPTEAGRPASPEFDILLVGCPSGTSNQSLSKEQRPNPAQSLTAGSLVRLGRVGWDIDVPWPRDLSLAHKGATLGVCADWRVV